MHRLFGIVLAVALFGATFAARSQTATYDSATGILTIPAVAADGVIYVNVTLLNAGNYTFALQSATAQVPPAFQLSGDPESAAGATWTYRATIDGIVYDMRGILKKPPGAGPFPAVILSHGGMQNSLAMLPTATEMATWGLVAIAANYTHATDTGAPIGSPGVEGERGATLSNILRARKVLELLSRLGYVDMNRVAAHGISNGGFVTTAILATYPTAFRVASHAAAGVLDPATGSPPSAPTPTLAAAVRTPYSLHHGDPDDTNPLSSDQRLVSILQANGVAHELWIYAGRGHIGFIQDPTFYSRIRAWYTRFGLF